MQLLDRHALLPVRRQISTTLRVTHPLPVPVLISKMMEIRTRRLLLLLLKITTPTGATGLTTTHLLVSRTRPALFSQN